MSEYSMSTTNAITLRQFDYFVNTVQLGSLSAAARKFGVTPSAMSQQLDALEGLLGRKLFDPQSRRSTLTKFGTEFFAQATDVVATVDRALTIGQTFSDGVMTIGTTPTIANKLLPPLIYRMRADRSTENIEVRSYTNIRELYSSLDNGALDIAVGPLGRSAARFVYSFGEEELVVACHHSQESKFDGSWDRLAEAPWIRCGSDSDLTGIIARESERAGVNIRYAVTAPDVTAALSMVEHGVGVALVPKMSLHGSSRLLSTVRLPRTIKRELIVHARDMSLHVEKFLEIITNSDVVRKFGAAGLLEIRRSVAFRVPRRNPVPARPVLQDAE